MNAEMNLRDYTMRGTAGSIFDRWMFKFGDKTITPRDYTRIAVNVGGGGAKDYAQIAVKMRGG